ncbi:MAG: glycosyltransferase [Bryobacteraceae bacterium]|nr:glycosyltransferase [Bryobacteraceae bacterium]
MGTISPIIVFSHLRWNFVYQRPQHVLSRLARQRPVLVIEEPVEFQEDIARWERREAAPNVTVMVPMVPQAQFTPGFASRTMKCMVEQLAVSELPGSSVVWVYTPAAVELLDSLTYCFLVYDCMDELSAFLHAPRELHDQEQRLLDRADVVFTGGPSLYRAKRDRHREVHCFPSSVDVDHFRNGVRVLAEAADQVAIPSPRLGYFGVIDERLDLDLLAQIADHRPEWQLVLVGPVVKIDPQTLPQRPNIHYLGGKQYGELPAYIKRWDVCLMPFAMNESTKFISPTKVLEYMAADKPIVSTPIADVVQPYQTMVRIGSTQEEFIGCCEEALSPPPNDWKTRQIAVEGVLKATSWDLTAEAMERIVNRGSREQPAVPVLNDAPVLWDGWGAGL